MQCFVRFSCPYRSTGRQSKAQGLCLKEYCSNDAINLIGTLVQVFRCGDLSGAWFGTVASWLFPLSSERAMHVWIRGTHGKEDVGAVWPDWKTAWPRNGDLAVSFRCMLQKCLAIADDRQKTQHRAGNSRMRKMAWPSSCTSSNHQKSIPLALSG